MSSYDNFCMNHFVSYMTGQAQGSHTILELYSGV